jgi:crotonobetaine/carnitine-CoA ligase
MRRARLPLVDLLEQRRVSAPRSPFLHAEGVTWTGEQLVRRAAAAGAALARAGVRPHDHVALLLDNSADFVALFFGLARLGAVAVTVNTALRGDGLAHVLRHSDARLLVVEERLVDLATGAAGSDLDSVWVRGAAGEASLAAQLEGWQRASHDPPLRRDPGDVAAILYTSGTTGAPKGVMLTDHGYATAATWFAESLRLGPDDVLQTCLPLFHVNAQQLSLCGALVAGATLVLDPRFSASGFWDSIVEHRVTSFNLIGAMLGILHVQAPCPEESAHRVRVACVAPTPPEIHRECEERFGIMLLDGYGLTETTPGNTYNPYGASRPGSCGKPAPYIEVRIADEHGDPLPPGERGEIVLRAREPHIFMAGYYTDPEATARAFRDGWFRTGDRGFLDEDGYLYFVDRIKDVIRRRGENISAVEIERVARDYPGVLEAAAVGVPSDLAGGEEDVALFLLADPGATVEPDALVEHCSARLAEFMIPRYVEVLEEFPRTETQRVRKAALRERGVAECYDRLRPARGGVGHDVRPR